MNNSEVILVADIGGTSSRFAEFVVDGSAVRMQNSIWLQTKDYASFPALLQAVEQQFAQDSLRAFHLIVIAVAGPVREGRYCAPPNIDWEINLDECIAELALPRILLINDFIAQAFAVISPLRSTFDVVLPGTEQPDFPKVITGVGTGLGKSALVPLGTGGYHGVASEGGHSALAIERQDEVEFFNFLRSQTEKPYVEWEEVLSGRGLERVHEFVTGERLSAASIAATLIDGSATLDLFARFLGRMCRNFVLEYMARGGLYIAGGVVAKNPVIVASESFTESLRCVAVPSVSIDEVPVFLMDEQDSGLWGAVMYGINS